MKRKLLKQMCAEWRSNIWMAIELLIVSVVMFFIADKLYVAAATYLEPLGFDARHCYVLDVAMLSEDAPGYMAYEDRESKYKDLRKLEDRVRTRPEIEAAAFSMNAYPYNPNTSYYQVDIDTFSLSDAPLLRRAVEPDFFKVFKIEGSRGETPDELAEILKRDRILLSDNALEDRGIKSLKDLYGVQLATESDTTELHTSFKAVRYNDYSSKYNSTGKSMFTLIPGDWYDMINECTVRVKAGMDKDFAENIMKDSENELRAGNWYIRSVKSFDTIRKNKIRYAEAGIRDLIVCAIFLLFNIFLGILGTFWFRTQQRAKEIALRMVNGATRTDILRRTLSEGELLLILVTPFAITIDFLLTKYELTSWYNGYLELAHFCVSVISSFALLAIMIAIGICFPARRAMHVSPAVTLKSE